MPFLLPALLLLLVAILGAGLLLLTVDPKVLARSLRYGIVAAFVLLGLFLAARGLALLDLPLGALVLILLRGWSARGFSGFDRLKDWLLGVPSHPARSTIETAWLRMTLDRSSGALDGEVLAGRFSGARLDDLGLEQLRALLAECEVADAQSARLLETYIDRTHPGWRERPRGAGQSDIASGADMTRAEAWQVLGLEPGADAGQIHEAHRRLMMKLHPDHGGSNYLASKINKAREVLLGSG
jgi:DnaJ domain